METRQAPEETGQSNEERPEKPRLDAWREALFVFLIRLKHGKMELGECHMVDTYQDNYKTQRVWHSITPYHNVS